MKEVIGNRVVGFIGHGPSLSEFKDKVELFKGKDICWVSLNQVQIAMESTTEVIVHNKYGDGVFQPAEKYFDAAKELGVL